MSEEKVNTVFTTCPGIFSYVTVFKPKFDDARVDRETGEPIPLFSIQFLFSKKEKTFKKEFDAAVKAAFDKDVKKGKFNAKMWKLLKKPLRDGDEELDGGIQEDPVYKGMYFFNAATTKTPPDVMYIEDGEVVPIEIHKEFYSGCKGRLLGSCYGFTTGKKGIAVGLNGCLKTGDGPRLDGRPDVKSAFDDFVDEGETAAGNFE